MHKSKGNSVIIIRDVNNILKMQNVVYAFKPTIILHTNDFWKF